MGNIIEELKKLEIESISRDIHIVGSEKGKWIHEKILELKPKKILELGTATGYSGIILGSEGAELVTIEKDNQRADEAKENFKQFGINANIIIEDGVEIVNGITSNEKEAFDLIFIDFYKKRYFKVLEDCLKLVKIGGYIIADNITFEGCQDYRNAILNDNRLKTEIINIKDGLSISKRLA